MVTARISLAMFVAAMHIGGAAAQSTSGYPARPLRIIVPLAPGGNVDLVARALAQQMSDNIGQQVIALPRQFVGGLGQLTHLGRPLRLDAVTAVGAVHQPQLFRHVEQALHILAEQAAQQLHAKNDAEQHGRKNPASQVAIQKIKTTGDLHP